MIVPIGALERQHSRRTPLRLLRRYPIHHLPYNDPSAVETTPAPSTSLRRIFYLRRLRRWCGDRGNLSSRPIAHALCSAGEGACLYLPLVLRAGHRSVRRAAGLFPRMQCSCRTDCAIYGPFLHNIRDPTANNGIVQRLPALRIRGCRRRCSRERAGQDRRIPIGSSQEAVASAGANQVQIRAHEYPGISRSFQDNPADPSDTGGTRAVSRLDREPVQGGTRKRGHHVDI